MKCYSLEELFDFAMNPLQEKNAEIASHLTRCKSCMEDYQLILDTLNEKDPELLPEEIAHAETVTRTFFAAKYNWNDFQNFIGRIANTLQEQVKRGLSFLNTANLFQAEPATLFAASGKELKGSASGAVPAGPSCKWHRAPCRSGYGSPVEYLCRWNGKPRRQTLPALYAGG